jgi:hypothetical protein
MKLAPVAPEIPRDQRLAAALYVLSREDMPVPPPLSERDILRVGAEDVKASVSMLVHARPHAFANLFGSLGGTTGAVVGSSLGRLFGDRGRWTAIMAGTILGTYPPAFAGFAIDKVVDQFATKQ